MVLPLWSCARNVQRIPLGQDIHEMCWFSPWVMPKAGDLNRLRSASQRSQLQSDVHGYMRLKLKLDLQKISEHRRLGEEELILNHQSFLGLCIYHNSLSLFVFLGYENQSRPPISQFRFKKSEICFSKTTHVAISSIGFLPKSIQRCIIKKTCQLIIDKSTDGGCKPKKDSWFVFVMAIGDGVMGSI